MYRSYFYGKVTLKFPSHPIKYDNGVGGGRVVPITLLKVACRVQIWKKKHFVKIVTSLVTVLFKVTLYICIYFVFTKKQLF